LHLLKEEIERSKSIASVATRIIENGHLVLKAKKQHEDRMDANSKLPKMLEG
jgi:hypothetical protein